MAEQESWSGENNPENVDEPLLTTSGGLNGEKGIGTEDLHSAVTPLNDDEFNGDKEGESLHNQTDEDDNDIEILQKTGASNIAGSNVEENGTEVVIQNPPFIGQVFNAHEEAYTFYNNYAKVWGFSVRREKKARNSKGEITGAAFVCSCQGHRQPHKGEQKRESPMVTRFECKAKLRVVLNKTDSKWVVDKFNEQHTHEPVKQRLAHHLRSHRGLTEADKADFRFKKDAGMKPSQVMKLAVHTAGGHSKLGYTIKDGFNFSTTDRNERISEGDAATTLAYLESKKSTDAHFILRYTTDEEKKLHSLFWADSISVADISCFGELLAFDTTYKKNCYNMPLVIFTGINHHFQSCLFGSALLSDETEGSYTWALNILNELLGEKQLRTVVTDGDKAMRKAIANVFPDATHRLCAWHLSNNITARVKNRPDFEPRWSQFVTADYETNEWEEKWKALVEDCNLQNNQWVSKKLFERRSEWANTYLRSHFFAGLKTTSRCESVNAFVARYLERRFGLLEFFIHYDRWVRDMRESEVKLDFESNYGVPPLKSTILMPIEQSAAKLFSKAAFLEFRSELHKVIGCIKIKQTEEGNLHTYSVTMFNKEKVVEMRYNTETKDMECSCEKYKSIGIPCCHMIFVLKEEKVKSLPEKLVLKRWSKIPKSFDNLPQPSTLGLDLSYNIRYGTLQFLTLRFCLLGAETPLSFEVARGEMAAACDKLEMMKKTPGEREKFVLPTEFEGILNPNKVLFKGCRKRKGKKQLKKKKRKCGRCGRRDGNYISTCPESEDYVRPATESSSDEEDGNDDMDDESDDREDGDDYGDDDDDQSGQPPKKKGIMGHPPSVHQVQGRQPQQKEGPRTRSTSTINKRHGESSQDAESSRHGPSRYEDRPGDEHHLKRH